MALFQTTGESILMQKDILCDGKMDCENAEDEQIANCKDYYAEDGASCDNGTKWIRQKFLCTGKQNIRLF